MWMEAATHGLAFVLGLATLWYGERLLRGRRRLDATSDAASSIRLLLRDIRGLLLRLPDVDVASGEMSGAWRRCADLMVEHDHRLPTSWVHLRRSVRAALGEVCGRPSWGDLTLGPVISEMAEFDRVWWDHARSATSTTCIVGSASSRTSHSALVGWSCSPSTGGCACRGEPRST